MDSIIKLEKSSTCTTLKSNDNKAKPAEKSASDIPMEVSTESLYERYSTMNTEALSDLYHESDLTDLAVGVLEKVISSRGLDWTEFITPLPTEPESLSDWELWKSESKKAADEYRLESKHKAIGSDSKSKFGPFVFLVGLIAVLIVIVITEPERLWGLAVVIFFAVLGVAVEAVQEVRSAICPSCRRWFAFKKKVGTRLISREQSKTKEEKWVCAHCGHRKWVEVSQSGGGSYVGGGGYVGSGDNDDGGAEGTCGAGGE